MKLSVLSGLSALALCAGCALSHSDIRVPMAGGGMASFSFDKNGAIPPQNGDVKIEKSVFAIEPKAKTGKYFFAFTEKRGGAPAQVTVEDVTEDPAVPWVQDEHPHLTGKRWEWISPEISFEDKAMKWLRELDPSIRVYRFTIRNQDGQKFVLNSVATYSNDVKEYVKQKELEAPPAPKAAPAEAGTE